MLRQDLGYAWRVLREHPLVTATIVLTLGLGIGANTAVFSLLNAVVLRRPCRSPTSDELYAVNGGPLRGVRIGERALVGADVRRHAPGGASRAWASRR